jgi:D-xylulose reductase
MQALVLEKTKELSLRDIEIAEEVGPGDVRIAVRVVGICGSDIQYYLRGRIGPFVVEEPMVLGHEASGEIVEVGSDVRDLKVGDRVCMEPGVPDPESRAARLGMYNLDPAVRFWATPPVHGCLRETVVHPAGFTFKLPENVSLEEAAVVEPLAVGMHAANKARIKPGDVAVVIGAGTIGIVTAMAAVAGGASRIIISDVKQPKLDLAAGLGPVTPVNVTKEKLGRVVKKLTGGWGADIVFEASGNEKAAAGVIEPLCPGGCVVLIGMPGGPIALDVVAAAAKEARIETVFRYANVYERALALMGSGKIDVKPLITDTFEFKDSVKAFEFASEMPPRSVKAEIVLPS